MCFNIVNLFEIQAKKNKAKPLVRFVKKITIKIRSYFKKIVSVSPSIFVVRGVFVYVVVAAAIALFHLVNI